MHSGPLGLLIQKSKFLLTVVAYEWDGSGAQSFRQNKNYYGLVNKVVTKLANFSSKN